MQDLCDRVCLYIFSLKLLLYCNWYLVYASIVRKNNLYQVHGLALQNIVNVIVEVIGF